MIVLSGGGGGKTLSGKSKVNDLGKVNISDKKTSNYI